MSLLSIFQTITLFCLLAVITAIPVSDEKAILIPDKPQGVILQNGYQVVYPGPVDLSVVFSEAFQQVVGGIRTILHASVDYLARLVGREP